MPSFVKLKASIYVCRGYFKEKRDGRSENRIPYRGGDTLIDRPKIGLDLEAV
jgi:hypothetical protein